MKVISFYREGLKLVPMEVELSLVPGLPQMKILGLPDAVVRESIDRIRVALKAQGFKWPKARQIIVQLHPVHVRKTCLGLDLAIAAAFLWESGQVPPPSEIAHLYGELSLSGEVIAPSDISEIIGSNEVYTGECKDSELFDLLCIKELKDIGLPQKIPRSNRKSTMRRPALPQVKLEKQTARVLSIVATGEHSVFFVGPAGSGKTTSARLLHGLLKAPTETKFRESQIVARYFTDFIDWRPLAQPHHQTTAPAMIGGAKPPVPGEISRAHGGILLLDEFLEFDQSVREALREPVEMGKISVSRVGERVEFPADFLLAATSNLCQCGAFQVFDDSQCTCDQKRRNAYIARVSGPMLDRFAVLHFTQPWSTEALTVKIGEVAQAVERAQKFARTDRKQEVVNSKLEAEGIFGSLSSFLKTELFPHGFDSARRYQSVLRVSRTLADLGESSEIQAVHLTEALDWANSSFVNLRNSIHSRDMDKLRQSMLS